MHVDSDFRFAPYVKLEFKESVAVTTLISLFTIALLAKRCFAQRGGEPTQSSFRAMEIHPDIFDDERRREAEVLTLKELGGGACQNLPSDFEGKRTVLLNDNKTSFAFEFKKGEMTSESKRKFLLNFKGDIIDDVHFVFLAEMAIRDIEFFELLSKDNDVFVGKFFIFLIRNVDSNKISDLLIKRVVEKFTEANLFYSHYLEHWNPFYFIAFLDHKSENPLMNRFFLKVSDHYGSEYLNRLIESQSDFLRFNDKLSSKTMLALDSLAVRSALSGFKFNELHVGLIRDKMGWNTKKSAKK